MHDMAQLQSIFFVAINIEDPSGMLNVLTQKMDSCMIEYQLPTFYKVFFIRNGFKPNFFYLPYFYFEGSLSSREYCVVCRRQKRRARKDCSWFKT
jgi:hypothetical protein